LATKSYYALGVALALAGACVLSAEALLVRLVDAGVWTIIWWRGTLVAITIGSWLCVTNPQGLNPRALGVEGLIAAFMSAGCVALFVIAITTTSAANTFLIASIAPLLAALTSWYVLGEPISRATTSALPILGLGVVTIMSGGSGGGTLTGDLFAFAYALWLANYFTALRCCPSSALFPVIAYAGLFSALISMPFAQPLGVSSGDALILVLLGIVIIPASMTLLAFGTRLLPAPDIVLIMMVETVLAPFWIWLVLGEVPGQTTLIGGSIILTAVFIHTMAESVKKTTTSSSP
jgi:drug/metabolite transporter (DMT)-like permease